MIKRLQHKLQIEKRGKNYELCDTNFISKNILDLDCYDIIKEQQQMEMRQKE